MMMLQLFLFCCQTTSAQAASPPPSAISPRTQANINEPESLLIARTLADRKQSGLKTVLTPDPILIVAAQLHSNEMLTQGYFSHESPTPGLKTVVQRYRQALAQQHQPLRKNYSVAENIFSIHSTRPLSREAVVQQAELNFMKSAGHRKNILNPSWKNIGTGVVEGKNRKGENVWYVTVMFSS